MGPWLQKKILHLQQLYQGLLLTLLLRKVYQHHKELAARALAILLSLEDEEE
jgi:hypothetical protein